MYDIIFIDNQSYESKIKLQKLRERFPLIKTVIKIDKFDYTLIFKKSVTKMFWLIDLENEDYINPNFNFDYVVLEWDQKYVHIFKQGDNYGGVYLISKDYPMTSREFEYKFFMKTKNIDINASYCRDFDIVFISYQEPNAEENFQKLKNKFPRVKRIHGIKGIHQAHIAAAKISETSMFWVVDGDAIILEDFNFDYKVKKSEKTVVHVWRSRNLVNGLVYGYGGVKLLPTEMTIDMDVTSPDMTTSISKRFKVVDTISNETAFNTDPFNTWKSAFRECVKLSSKTIHGQKKDETEDRLQTWITQGLDNPFGKYCIDGAIAGKEWGEIHKDDTEKLRLINDFNWLKNKFNKKYKDAK